MPIVRREPVEWRSHFYYQHSYNTNPPRSPIAKCEGIRDRRWKYIRYPESEPLFEQLFDLESDPLERKNLAPLTGQATKLAEMRESGDFAEWVDRVSHIQERRMLDMDASAGDMAREASQRALESSGVDPADIDIVLMATFTTKNVYPGEQTKLVRDLGIHGGDAPTFCLTAGCAGSVYGLQTAYAFLKAGMYRNALVIGTEHLTSVVDLTGDLPKVIA